MAQDPRWSDALVLGDDAPFAIDQPFTTPSAVRAGVSKRLLADLLRRGCIRRVLHGVCVASQVPDSLRLRVAALKLVVPQHAVVVDRTACWLHGVASGIRDLLPRDTEDIEGLLVTTRLRTACDVGRRVWRYDAIGCLDSLLRAGVERDELLNEIDRFKGFRGVRQLRELAPIADKRSESQPEAALRLRWVEADLPAPEPQVWVHDDDGTPRYRIDIGHRETRYGAEYFGEEFHSEDQADDDASRLTWLRKNRAWTLDVFDKDSVYGRRPDPTVILQQGFAAALARTRHRAATTIDLSR